MDPELGTTYIEVMIDGESRVVSLGEHPTCSIGRGTQNTVVLANDIMVSRKHALIQREGSGDFYLSDLGSRNGTTLNGVPVTTPVALRDGDTFTAGSHRFLFRDKTPALPPEMSAVAQDATGVLVVRRMITIMVADIRNYTVLARQLGEDRISEVMNDFFRACGELLKRNGSWGQKYIGDAVMAVWAHEEESGTPRELVLMLDSLVGVARVTAHLNAQFDLPQPLSFGAGVNTGYAVTGNMGSAGLSDHTAMGDAVNKAFRLETASKEIGRGVVFGSSTYDLLAPPEPVRSLFTTHTVSLKGYDQPEEVYALDVDQVAALLQSVRE